MPCELGMGIVEMLTFLDSCEFCRIFVKLLLMNSFEICETTDNEFIWDFVYGDVTFVFKAWNWISSRLNNTVKFSSFAVFASGFRSSLVEYLFMILVEWRERMRHHPPVTKKISSESTTIQPPLWFETPSERRRVFSFSSLYTCIF